MDKTEEKYIYLADGSQVPKVCVDALDELDQRWPGATFPGARAGIARAVIKAYEKEKKSNVKASKNT